MQGYELFIPGELAARIHVHLNLMRRARVETTAPAQAEVRTAEPADADTVVVNAAKRLIVDNLTAVPNLAEIARSVGTYREKLSELFREQTGMTVFGFVREERLKLGMELLRETGIDVQEIALLTGFNNAGHFATAFRERTGATPSAFRQAEGLRQH